MYRSYCIDSTDGNNTYTYTDTVGEEEDRHTSGDTAQYEAGSNEDRPYHDYESSSEAIR